ncbi:MAG: primosomal protein N', partial [Patescibacteria group bacterium]
GIKNKTQEYTDWRRMISGQAKIIIGTRATVLAPFANLKHIILLDDTNDSHKQWDQNPRYDARTAAAKLAELWGADYMVVTTSPQVATIAAWRTTGTIDHDPTPLLPARRINLADEVRGGNYALLSDAAQAAVTAALAKHQGAFLLLNRRGLAGMVSCRDCKYAWPCPHCELPLAAHQGGKLFCHRCDYVTELPVVCPKCRGSRLAFRGRGTQQLARDAAKLWPAAPITRLDSDADQSPVAMAAADIIIGTDQSLRQLPWAKIGAVVLVDADTLRYLPVYDAQERLWHLIRKLRAAASLSQATAVLIQTNNPEQPTIAAASSNADPTKWYEQELAERQQWHYPPAWHLTKLMTQLPTKPLAIATAQALAQQLTSLQKTSKITADIIEPKIGHIKQIRGKYRISILIKHPGPISALLGAVGEGWLIDVDPIDLL